MQTQLLIGGDWLAGTGGGEIEVENPATEVVIASVAAGTPADATAACDAAAEAQPAWAATAPRERAEILRASWQRLVDHTDELAELITAEHGKPLADARAEVAYSAEFFRWNAEEAVRIHGTLGWAPSGANRIVVHHPPVGRGRDRHAVELPGGDDHPQARPGARRRQHGRDQATGAHAAHCAADRRAPPRGRAARRRGEHRADEVVGRLVRRRRRSSGDADGVVHRFHRGRHRPAEAGGRPRAQARDGARGNAPFIVFDDADIDAAVEGAMVAKMRHSAETCTAANRFFVHDAVADEFNAKFAAAMGAVKVGNGMDDGVTCGPMINADAIDSIDELVSGAVDGGATVSTGGHRGKGAGYFYEATVLDNVAADAEITGHEIFGPVAPIIRFDDTDAMIAQANNTEMGLTGYVYTRDLARGLSVSERIQAGMIGLNRGAVSDPAAPFGGMKQSGLGREGASDGIYEFCETQYIATNW